METKGNLKEIASLFLKLGFTAFGGPAAHIAMMHREVVEKRKWLTEQDFLDMIGATNLIPGPNSTEMAIHIGQHKGGAKGLIIAGLCFILPAVTITLLFAWMYQRFGQLPSVKPFIYGIKPAIIAVILAAIFPLAKKSLKNTTLWFLGCAVLLLGFAGVNELLLLLGAGFLAVIIELIAVQKTLNSFWLAIVAINNFDTNIHPNNIKLFLIFIKIGAMLYGSGYVLFAFLDAELVATGMITREQLIDAIAVGQFTPGPVFSSVTFIGYQISGFEGAMVSTLAIFLPSFVFVALLKPIMKLLRKSKVSAIFLDAVNVASVAIILVACSEMAQSSITEWRSVLIAIISLLVVFRFKTLNSAFVVLGGSILGFLLYLI